MVSLFVNRIELRKKVSYVYVNRMLNLLKNVNIRNYRFNKLAQMTLTWQISFQIINQHFAQAKQFSNMIRLKELNLLCAEICSTKIYYGYSFYKLIIIQRWPVHSVLQYLSDKTRVFLWNGARHTYVFTKCNYKEPTSLIGNTRFQLN